VCKRPLPCLLSSIHAAPFHALPPSAPRTLVDEGQEVNQATPMPYVDFEEFNVTVDGAPPPPPANGSAAGGLTAAGRRALLQRSRRGSRKYDLRMAEGLLRTLRGDVVDGAQKGVTLSFQPELGGRMCTARVTKKAADRAAGGALRAIPCKACDRCLRKLPAGSVVNIRARANKAKVNGRKFSDGQWSDPPVKFTV
jgi:hypothetical protein